MAGEVIRSLGIETNTKLLLALKIKVVCGTPGLTLLYK